MVFIPAETNISGASEDLFVVINKTHILCVENSAWRPLSSSMTTALGPYHHRHYLGTLDGEHCYAVYYDHLDAPQVEGFQWYGLRHQLGASSEEYFQLAGRALQLTRWYLEHQFCGVCGSPTSTSSVDRALVCENCEARFYPRISPCVIGLVRKGDMCLLAQGVKHPQGLYSTLAGFIEPGESAEQAFAREVGEEVGIEIKNLRYFGSQPWPFPGQLMLGFTADYAAGEICIDDDEIVDAQWFRVDSLPNIPPVSTIAGRLIQDFVEQVKG
ncbi:NAD(+) diphosphatase [Agarilytica rhodophyticola]|uniref:NAD(+) diphosphatase n=1 Tax=Agarilytica rhodophyticola TaxID=1737490 RepID=UPI000B3471A1|nr:NAD(+) diphosphatase [Agarilytica rhodophyticola]